MQKEVVEETGKQMNWHVSMEAHHTSNANSVLRFSIRVTVLRSWLSFLSGSCLCLTLLLCLSFLPLFACALAMAKEGPAIGMNLDVLIFYLGGGLLMSLFLLLKKVSLRSKPLLVILTLEEKTLIIVWWITYCRSLRGSIRRILLVTLGLSPLLLRLLLRLMHCMEALISTQQLQRLGLKKSTWIDSGLRKSA